MHPRQRVALILLGAAALAVGMFVLITARNWDIHLLAVVCVLGGLGMIVVAIP